MEKHPFFGTEEQYDKKSLCITSALLVIWIHLLITAIKWTNYITAAFKKLIKTREFGQLCRNSLDKSKVLEDLRLKVSQVVQVSCSNLAKTLKSFPKPTEQNYSD